MANDTHQGDSKVADWIHVFESSNFEQFPGLKQEDQARLADTLALAYRLSSAEQFLPESPMFSGAESFASRLIQDTRVRPFGEVLWTRENMGRWGKGRHEESPASYPLPEAIARELLRIRRKSRGEISLEPPALAPGVRDENQRVAVPMQQITEGGKASPSQELERSLLEVLGMQTPKKAEGSNAVESAPLPARGKTSQQRPPRRLERISASAGRDDAMDERREFTALDPTEIAAGLEQLSLRPQTRTSEQQDGKLSGMPLATLNPALMARVFRQDPALPQRIFDSSRMDVMEGLSASGKSRVMDLERGTPVRLQPELATLIADVHLELIQLSQSARSRDGVLPSRAEGDQATSRAGDLLSGREIAIPGSVGIAALQSVSEIREQPIVKSLTPLWSNALPGSPNTADAGIGLEQWDGVTPSPLVRTGKGRIPAGVPSSAQSTRGIESASESGPMSVDPRERGGDSKPVNAEPGFVEDISLLETLGPMPMARPSRDGSGFLARTDGVPASTAVPSRSVLTMLQLDRSRAIFSGTPEQTWETARNAGEQTIQPFLSTIGGKETPPLFRRPPEGLQALDQPIMSGIRKFPAPRTPILPGVEGVDSVSEEAIQASLKGPLFRSIGGESMLDFTGELLSLQPLLQSNVDGRMDTSQSPAIPTTVQASGIPALLGLPQRTQLSADVPSTDSLGAFQGSGPMSPGNAPESLPSAGLDALSGTLIQNFVTERLRKDESIPSPAGLGATTSLPAARIQEPLAVEWIRNLTTSLDQRVFKGKGGQLGEMGSLAREQSQDVGLPRLGTLSLQDASMVGSLASTLEQVGRTGYGVEPSSTADEFGGGLLDAKLVSPGRLGGSQPQNNSRLKRVSNAGFGEAGVTFPPALVNLIGQSGAQALSWSTTTSGNEQRGEEPTYRVGEARWARNSGAEDIQPDALASAHPLESGGLGTDLPPLLRRLEPALGIWPEPSTAQGKLQLPSADIRTFPVVQRVGHPAGQFSQERIRSQERGLQALDVPRILGLQGVDGPTQSKETISLGGETLDYLFTGGFNGASEMTPSFDGVGKTTQNQAYDRASDGEERVAGEVQWSLPQQQDWEEESLDRTLVETGSTSKAPVGEPFSSEDLRAFRPTGGAPSGYPTAGNIAQAVASQAMLSETPGNQIEASGETSEAESTRPAGGDKGQPKIDLDRLARELAGRIQERLKRHNERIGR